MSSYFLAPAAVQLRDEINVMFPERDKASDGWIGDPSHAARRSEHNPCWYCSGRNYGIVLATDTDIDDRDPKRNLRVMLINELIGDPRVWYIISNGIIYSRTYGFRPRRYTGSNSHHKHVHVSFRLAKAWDTRPFFEKAKKPKPRKPPYLDISKLRDAMLVAVKGGKVEKSIDVLRYQRLMNARIGAGLKVDGYAGEKTLNASARMERKYGGGGRPRVPDDKTIRNANKGMFRVVK